MDNLKIGGTNLLIDSGTLPLTLLRPGDDTPGYGGNNLLAATGVDAGYRGNNRVDTNKAWAGLSLNLRKNAEGRIKVGDEVTLSIRVMMDNDATGLRFGLYRVTNTNTDVTLKSDIPGATNRAPNSIDAPLLKGGVWYTLWGTFTVEEWLLSPGNSGQRFEQAVDTSYPVHWSSPKLEMGNTPTDWSPAPEDADATYATKAALSVESDRITGVVTEQAGLAGRVSTVEQKSDSLSVTLGEVADDASSALTAAEAAADMAQSAATNSADAIAQTNAAVAANTSILDSFSVDELNQVLARVRVVQAGGVPALQLGSTTSGLWAQLTNSQLSFMDASTCLLYTSPSPRD